MHEGDSYFRAVAGGAFAAAGGVPRRPSSSDPCPCGRGRFGACCGPILEGSPADTAENLMRSRYVAFAVGDDDHLFRTWHPRTRPAEAGGDGKMRWTGLQIIDVVAGGGDDLEGVVEFVARYEMQDGEVGQLQERSRFTRRAGRWVYLDAEG
ncbi:YchJ family protein [Arthrobacter monumenti]